MKRENKSKKMDVLKSIAKSVKKTSKATDKIASKKMKKGTC